jgi:hypothetical protein
MGDWLGTGTIAPRLRSYRPFNEARAFARHLALKNLQDWVRFCKGELSTKKGTLPQDIPAKPMRVYSNQGWLGLGDWLGADRSAKASRPRKQ